MKNKVIDQAEKLRQLAQNETKPNLTDSATATLEPAGAETEAVSHPSRQNQDDPAAPPTLQTAAPNADDSPKETNPSPAQPMKRKAQADMDAGTPSPAHNKTQTDQQKSAQTPPAPKKTQEDKSKISTPPENPGNSVESPPPAADTSEAKTAQPKNEPSDKPAKADKPSQEEPIQDKPSSEQASSIAPSPATQPSAKTAEPETAQPAKDQTKTAPPASLPSAPEPVTQNETVSSIVKNRRFPVEKRTQVIAVTGGKGGVGKSNVTCNLALSMVQMGKRVMILDADLSLANIDVLLGLTPRKNLSHVLVGEKQLSEIIIQGPQGLQIIPSGSGLEELTHLTPEKMEHLFNAFTSLSPMPDILLIDTAAGIHPNVMQFLLSADQTIVVTTPEPTAYTDAYALIKTLVRHDPAREIGVIVNMAQDRREALEVTKLMLQMCRQFLKIAFNNLGYIPRDPEVLKAVRRQKPLLLTAPHSPASREMHNIASTVLQIEKKENRGGLKRFFNRLFSFHSQPKAAS